MNSKAFNLSYVRSSMFHTATFEIRYTASSSISISVCITQVGDGLIAGQVVMDDGAEWW